MDAIICSDICNIIIKFNFKMRISEKGIYLPEFIKNGHNSASDGYFFLETCTIVLSTHRAIYLC